MSTPNTTLYIFMIPCIFEIQRQGLKRGPAFSYFNAQKNRIAPIHECLMPAKIFEIGIGNVIISRKLPGGIVATGVFLVDVFCLGVKDAFFTILFRDKHEEFKRRAEQDGEMVNIEPAYARKLIEDAVLYAMDLEFSPHKNYKKASKIFGEIDPHECTETFTFGKDNMPYFVNSPNDSPSKCKQILDKLNKRCGEGNFLFTVMAGDFFADYD